MTMVSLAIFMNPEVGMFGKCTSMLVWLAAGSITARVITLQSAQIKFVIEHSRKASADELVQYLNEE